LEESVARQRALGARGDLRGLLEEDRAFHTALVEAGDNSFFTQLYASLRDRQVRMIAGSRVDEPDRHEDILTEHAAIAAAVGRGDLEAARAAVRDHLASTRSALGLSP
jgi:DNA-binding GntR family transcriptional regulator